MQQRVVVATRSVGKMREMRAILEARGFASDTLDDVGIPETPAESWLEQFETFAENASAKAEYFAGLLPGRAVIADDSGLAVDALGGQPGVRSKRWSNVAENHPELDAINNAMLLAELGRVGAQLPQERGARYVCAMACVMTGDHPIAIAAEGHCDGVILDRARGAGGFGYDPFFFSTDLQRTFAEVSCDEKAAVSHRARALRALLDAMEQAGLG